MECVAELCGSQIGAFDVVAVGLVDDYAVGHFHDAALYALQLVACAGELYQQEEVDHRVNGGFALSYSYGFNEYVVIAGGLADTIVSRVLRATPPSDPAEGLGRMNADGCSASRSMRVCRRGCCLWCVRSTDLWQVRQVCRRF